MSPDLDNLMAFAEQTARRAGELTRSHFGRTDVEWKGDGSEVTVADRAAEDLIRETIAEAFPDHGVFGEERDETEGAGEYRWIIDPIDGTRSFASGVPLYAILIALEHRGRPEIGCAYFPELDDMVVAGNGAGCWWNGRRARVSECDALESARLVTSGLEYWRDWGTEVANDGFRRLLAEVRFGRTWGDAFGYALVATGRVEILADPACGAYWDYAPMLPILNEAGGSFTTLSGRQVGSWSSALASNGALAGKAMGFWDGLDDDEIQTAACRLRRTPVG